MRRADSSRAYARSRSRRSSTSCRRCSSCAASRFRRPCRAEASRNYCAASARHSGIQTPYIEVSSGEIAIRTPTHIYGIRLAADDKGRQQNIADDGAVFFDLGTDPYEINNLAKSSEQREIA